MPQPRLITLTSPEELLAHAAAWDDLWRRSQCAVPTLQADLLALWLRQFAPLGCFRALVVEDAGQLVAALPLCGRRLKGLLSVAGLTHSPWSACNDLLLDETCDAGTCNDERCNVPRALDLLLAAAAQLPQTLLWLDPVIAELPRWQAWQAAARRAGLACDVHAKFDVAVVDASRGWEALEESLSRDFRRNLRRRIRQLEEQGSLALRAWHESGQPAIADALRRAAEMEDQTWKGQRGTSILRTPGMLDYFTRQAELLAQRGQLALHFLELDGRPIAFEYGYLAKGMYFAHKVSYLPEHQKAAPGHVLRWHLLRRLCEQGGFRGMDFFGPLTEAAQRWMTGRYTASRLVVCPPRMLSRTLMAAYTRLWPQVRRFRS